MEPKRGITIPRGWRQANPVDVFSEPQSLNEPMAHTESLLTSQDIRPDTLSANHACVTDTQKCHTSPLLMTKKCPWDREWYKALLRPSLARMLLGDR